MSLQMIKETDGENLFTGGYQTNVPGYNGRK
jgi:hypothetical protein